MEKLYDKKNFGVPATILCVIAYLTGYLMTYNLEGGLLVGILLAAIVFGFQFDDRIKRAVKQAYIVAFVARVVAFGFSLLESFIELIMPQGVSVSNIYNYDLEELSDMHDMNAFQNIIQYVLKYGKEIWQVLLIIIFMIFIIQALRNKEFTLKFVYKTLNEAPPMVAPMYQQPMYQQPMNPAQQVPGNPMNQAPVNPMQQAPVNPSQQAPVNPGAVCQSCGRANLPGAIFCAGCGAKM
ncbi:MAG TPA: hypothetical protein VJ888_07330 [Mobilitalea sp.]|nr:hypothetical protein [Mobilitalea sp.]